MKVKVIGELNVDALARKLIEVADRIDIGEKLENEKENHERTDKEE
mgnify:CR=1 FL=1